MLRYLLFLCLVAPLFGCAEILGLDEFGAGSPGGNAGGMAGSGGIGGSGGNAGGMAGMTGSGGDAGMGGGGSPPCETGIYLTVDSQGPGGSLSATAGPVASTVYQVHGTSVGNELNLTLKLVNNLTADFTSPQDTNVLESVRIRCRDPAGNPTYTEVCNEPLVNGAADCVMPGCYSSIGDAVLMQLQVDPVASGNVRIGIDPDSVTICDDQTQNPVWNVQ